MTNPPTYPVHSFARCLEKAWRWESACISIFCFLFDCICFTARSSLLPTCTYYVAMRPYCSPSLMMVTIFPNTVTSNFDGNLYLVRSAKYLLDSLWRQKFQVVPRQLSPMMGPLPPPAKAPSIVITGLAFMTSLKPKKKWLKAMISDTTKRKTLR